MTKKKMFQTDYFLSDISDFMLYMGAEVRGDYVIPA